MNRFGLIFLLTLSTASSLVSANDDFPIVPEDFEVSLFARDPLVRNPCAITFDAKGRLCVGMGPQYRSPKPDTPPDSVWIITDENGDGSADKRQEFATGFNSIQGLAWKGEWLWIANAPDLTRVRDTNGDDIADEYIRVYTDLGNLEHALHGLNFGPDGRLYMSKGNSKGLTGIPDRIAPAPFRELWGVNLPPGIPEPKPRIFTAASYQKNYHDPSDDWGLSGGILRCDDDGSNLEIFSRGFRNPWDIAFDQSFDWLGTDNDQTTGDKIFAPFYGAHFGWGHAWSYDWKGDDHLPTAPASGPLFEGSGAGVTYCNLEGYPEKLRDAFLINDWLNREILIYRSKWQGALRQPDRNQLKVLAHAGGGRSMPLSSGRAFDPVDLEIGPDGAIWISSWGRQYGAHYEQGNVANEGRIYRIRPKSYRAPRQSTGAKTLESLISDLGSHLPVLRTNAQDKLIRMGNDIEPELLNSIENSKSTSLETWLIWTLGRINPESWFSQNNNQIIQSLRLAAFHKKVSPEITRSLAHSSPRVRLAAVTALHEISRIPDCSPLIQLAGTETDRLVYYATWHALMDHLPADQRKQLLFHKQAGIRLAAFLGLLEDDSLDENTIRSFLNDPHPPIAALAQKRLGGKHQVELRGRPLTTAIRDIHAKPIVIPFDQINASSGHLYQAATLTPGTPCYTDRPYLITKVPTELDGLTFLQTSCNDADATSGVAVTLNLKYPSTVYLIDDARAENLPTWARKKWKPTSLHLKGDDPRLMKVFTADFSAGPLTLGSNRDGIEARKGNYLIAVRPTLLTANSEVASSSSILSLLPGANPDRGRDLFMSPRGANCAACHQVAKQGNNHAPNLSEIGSRLNAQDLIKAIIDPNDSIVEGFAAHLVQTKDDKSHSGILLEETGRQITLALADGSKITTLKNQIKHRESLSVSPMPPGYHAILSSQQLADLTAWLLRQKKPIPVETVSGSFRFETGESGLHLFLNQKRIATYLLDHKELTRRAFVNLTTPSGISVTRNFPARMPEDLDPGYRGEGGIIHPHMHPGLWMSFGWINGNDYWRLRSKVIHEGFLEVPVGRRGEASFKSRDRYLSEDGKETIAIQETRYHFRQIKEGILLEWDAEFYNDDRDIIFGDQEESGLAFRIASPLRITGGHGQIINNRGEQNGSGTWGKTFEWINYSGDIGKKRVGLLVIPDSRNPRQSWSHSRDYGVLASNPFPKQPKERREPYITTTTKKGERFRLRYHILIHEVPAATFDPAQLAERIKTATK